MSFAAIAATCACDLMRGSLDGWGNGPNVLG